MRLFTFECPDCETIIGSLSSDSFEETDCEELYCKKCKKRFIFVLDGRKSCQNCKKRISCLSLEPIQPTPHYMKHSFNFNGAISKVNLNKNDILVLTTENHLGIYGASQLEKYISNKLPGQKCLVLDGGLQLSVLGRETNVKKTSTKQGKTQARIKKETCN